MKNKLIVGALSGLLVFGGAVAVGASKNDTRVEDSIHQEDKNLDSHVNGKKVEIETEHGQTVIKVKDDKSAMAPRSSSDDNTKAGDGAHHNRHSGDDDNKSGDGTHQNRHSGDEGSKAADGAHHNRHSGDDDTKTDDDNK